MFNIKLLISNKVTGLFGLQLYQKMFGFGPYPISTLLGNILLTDALNIIFRYRIDRHGSAVMLEHFSQYDLFFIWK